MSPSETADTTETLDNAVIGNPFSPQVVTPPPFMQFTQNYNGLDFGLPSSWQAISGDFNGDGITDYARLGDTNAWFFLGNGDGSFAPLLQTYQAPLIGFGLPSSWQAITGDFDGDGRTDYARLGDTGAWFFSLNAQGVFTQSFQVYQGISFGLPSQWQPITGDFNGDGKTDYARLGDTGAWFFSVNQFGSFEQSFQTYTSPIIGFGLPSKWQTITGDFNGDGVTDYARLGDNGAWFFVVNQFGSFEQSFQTYPNNMKFGLPSPWTPIAGDFNGDGVTDYARLGANGAWVFTVNEFGSFDSKFQPYASPVPSFGQPTKWQTITGDFNGDGVTDYARLGASTAWVFYGTSGGFLGGELESYEGVTFGLPSPWQVVTGDFMGSGKTSYARLGGPKAVLFVHR